jgi:hypothetical protein
MKQLPPSALLLDTEILVFPGVDVRTIAVGAVLNFERMEAMLDEIDFAVDMAFAWAGYSPRERCPA